MGDLKGTLEVVMKNVWEDREIRLRQVISHLRNHQ